MLKPSDTAKPDACGDIFR